MIPRVDASNRHNEDVLSMTNDDNTNSPSTAAQAAGVARKTAPWKRPAPIVGGRRGVAKRGSGAPRPAAQPKAATPAPSTPPARAPVVVRNTDPGPAPVDATASTTGSDPKRPWWKRRPPVVGGGRRPKASPGKATHVKSTAKAPNPQIVDDVAADGDAAALSDLEAEIDNAAAANGDKLEDDLDDLTGDDLGGLG